MEREDPYNGWTCRTQTSRRKTQRKDPFPFSKEKVNVRSVSSVVIRKRRPVMNDLKNSIQSFLSDDSGQDFVRRVTA